MEIRAEEITKIIREQLGGFTAGVDVSEREVERWLAKLGAV